MTNYNKFINLRNIMALVLKDFPSARITTLMPESASEPEDRSFFGVKDYNCYAHVLGAARLGWVSPGQLMPTNRAHAKTPHILHVNGDGVQSETPYNVKNALLADGWLKSSFEEINLPEDHAMVAIIGNEGFHCYRVHGDGSISGKNGKFRVSRPIGLNFRTRWKNLAQGAVSVNHLKPDDFVAGKDSQFVGVFKIPPQGLIIDERYRLKPDVSYPGLEAQPAQPV
ncbi:MAG: hypothetical protein AAGB32_03380 [Pseudomonadota bacterium]